MKNKQSLFYRMYDRELTKEQEDNIGGILGYIDEAILKMGKSITLYPNGEDMLCAFLKLLITINKIYLSYHVTGYLISRKNMEKFIDDFFEEAKIKTKLYLKNRLED